MCAYIYSFYYICTSDDSTRHDAHAELASLGLRYCSRISDVIRAVGRAMTRRQITSFPFGNWKFLCLSSLCLCLLRLHRMRQMSIYMRARFICETCCGSLAHSSSAYISDNSRRLPKLLPPPHSIKKNQATPINPDSGASYTLIIVVGTVSFLRFPTLFSNLPLSDRRAYFRLPVHLAAHDYGPTKLLQATIVT